MDTTRERKKPKVSAGSRLYKPRATAGPPKPKTKGERSRNAGKLATLMDITLDVFFEIVTHLRPVDLLQLCRVSKHFRTTFMSKSRRSLWVAARRNTTPLPLPEPLPGMSEPKLAALLFEHYCFACGVGRASKVYFALGFRFCAACAKLNIQPGYGVRFKHRNLPDLLKLVPMEVDCGERDELTNAEAPHDYQRMLSKCFATEYDEVAQTYYKIMDSPDSDQAIDEFVERRREYVDSIAKCAQAIYKWHQDCKRLNEQALNEVQKRREASIREKLYSLGYTENDLPGPTDWGFPGEDVWQSITVQPRELTPRIWKAAQGKLVDMLRLFMAWKNSKEFELRLSQRRGELRRWYTQWLGHVDVEDGPYPSISELRELPDIHVLIGEDDARIPIDQERFDKFVAPIMQMYKSSTRAALVKALRSAASQNAGVAEDGTTDDESEDILYNATSLFTNPHFEEDDEYYTSEDAPMRPLGFRELMIELRDVYESQCGPDDVEYKPSFAMVTARAILKAVGLPENTRYEDVDKRIICLCHKTSFAQPASFSLLVNHISHERWMHRRVHELIESRQPKDGSSDAADTVYFDDHDFEGNEEFLVLLDADETYVPEETGNDADVNKVVGRCRTCAELRPSGIIGFAKAVSMRELKRHVYAKHRRDFSDNDLVKIGPADWDYYNMSDDD